MRIACVLVGAALLALSGCTAQSPAVPSSAPAVANASQSPTPDPSSISTAVDPAGYRSLLPGLNQDAAIQGVDFDTSDRSITCSIFDPGTAGAGRWAGCYPFHPQFTFPAESAGGDPASAVKLVDSDPGQVFTLSDLVFPGAYPQTAEQVKVLSPGSDITWGSVTCTNAADTVTCTDASTQHGFSISNAAYSVQ